MIAGLAERLDSPVPFSTDPEEIFAELGRGLCGRPGRLRRHRLRADPRRARRLLALPDPDHPGTPRLFADRFATADGRARCVAVEHRGPAEQPTRSTRCT